MKPPSPLGLAKNLIIAASPSSVKRINPAEKSARLNGLTSLRFFAAASIVLLHFSIHFGYYKESVLKELALWQGVSFFFVLSGFILTYVYPQLNSVAQANRFLFARFSRVWPTHIAGLLLWLAVTPIATSNQLPLSAVLVNIAMLQSWLFNMAYAFSFNAPSWSISTEFFFYCLFPFLISGFGRTWLPKLLAAFALSLLGIFLCLGIGSAGLPDYKLEVPPYINVFPPSRVFEFVLGMVTCSIYRKVETSTKWATAKATLFECLGLLAVATALLLPAIWSYQDGWFGPVRVWLHCDGAAPVYAVLILLTALNRGLISNFLQSKPLVYLGEASYALYIYHCGVLSWFYKYEDAFKTWSPVASSFLLFLLTLVISRISFELLETPSRISLLSTYDKLLSGKKSFAFRPLNDFKHITTSIGKRLSNVRIEFAFLAVIAIIFCVQINAAQREFRKISLTEQQRILSKAEPLTQNTRFGDCFILKAMAFQRNDKSSVSGDQIKVDFVWQSLKQQKLNYIVAVEVLDKDGKLIFDDDYLQDPLESSMESSQIWHDTRYIPVASLSQGAALSIGLYKRDPLRFLSVYGASVNKKHTLSCVPVDSIVR